MATEDFKRKLTAVFSADVSGYSRLMGEDEAATVRTLEEYKQVLFSLIKQHRGKVIDSSGDNLLAEFASVVDAVQCGVAIQNELKARNEELPENRRMQFRIGVNLGDVIEEGDRIYGDGVNIAARLEALSDPGGICVSKTAFDYIESKLPLGYEFLGEQEVKNIAKPIGAYKVLMEPRVTGAGVKEKKHPIPVWRRKKVLGAAFAALIVIIGGAVWNLYWRTPKIEPASTEKMAFPLPDRPSIAVLPFDNMSKDPGQDYFSDGLAEDIITALSKVPQLFVIARNSSFSYKGKSVKVSQIAEDLGVRYVLEGSVRRSGDRIRITAQLIDALTGHHLWAERYDRKLEDIFTLQDEITMKILTALQLKLTAGELAKISAKGTRSLEAYLKVVQARGPFYTITKEGMAQARRLCEEALAIDPDYAAAYVYLGSTHFMDVMLGSSKSPKESSKLALEALTKATALDDSYAAAHSILGFIYVMKKQYDKGMAECERAVALEPNSATALIWMSFVLTLSGNHQEAVQPAERALRLDPLGPPWWLRALGQAYLWAGRYEDAVSAFKKSLQRAPDDIRTHIPLTCAYSWVGRVEEARAQAQEVLRINPKYCLKQDRSISLYKNKADRERYLDGLRKAGLPDKPPLLFPDKPSIAVLPFDNLSGDPEQGYFSDGLSEEIINALVRWPSVVVIPKSSSFIYKGKTVDVKQVGREMGVRYVLEGSVRRQGNKVRISANLIDVATRKHLFSERYEREMKDIFAIQDEITMGVLTAMRVSLSGTGVPSLRGKGTKSIEAYLKVLQAEAVFQAVNRETQARARRLAEEAIALDPEYARAYCMVAATIGNEVLLGVYKDRSEALKRAIAMAEKAVQLDDEEEAGHRCLGFLAMLNKDYKKAVAEAKRAVELAPNSVMAQIILGYALYSVGRTEEAIPILEKAASSSPIILPRAYSHLGVALRKAGRLEEAVEVCRKLIQIKPNYIFPHLTLAAAFAEMGKMEEARAEVQEVLRIRPNYTVELVPKSFPWKDQDELDRLADFLRKAGMPE